MQKISINNYIFQLKMIANKSGSITYLFRYVKSTTIVCLKTRKKKKIIKTFF